jgi:hypothetical protein
LAALLAGLYADLLTLAANQHMFLRTSQPFTNPIYPFLRIKKPHAKRSLKYQTRCAAAFGGGYALGSVEGRVAMEVFDASPAAQRRKYAFKVCARVVFFKGWMCECVCAA